MKLKTLFSITALMLTCQYGHAVPATLATPTLSKTNFPSRTYFDAETAKQLPDIVIRGNPLAYHPKRKKQLIVMSHKELEGQKYYVINEHTKEKILKGIIGKSISGKSLYAPFDYNYTLDVSQIIGEGKYTLIIDTKEQNPSFLFQVAYSSIQPSTRISEMLTHLKSTRSGTTDTLYHPATHLQDKRTVIVREANKETDVPKSYRGGVDEKLGLYTVDGKHIWKSADKNIDMLGGWYDAGDYIKFTLTNAATAYYLLEAYQTAPELFLKKRYLSKSKYNDLLDEAKHGLDYLLKTLPTDNDFIMQVGSQEDHNAGHRLPETDKLSGLRRPAFSALVPQHMGLVAAALSKASVVYRPYDETLADNYLAFAKKIWQRANQEDVLNYYPYDQPWFYNDESIPDNLALGAAELYKATKDKKYLTAAKQLAQKAGDVIYVSWESYHLPANLALSQYDNTAKQRVLNGLDFFKRFSLSQKPNDHWDDGNIWGRPMKSVWGGLYNELHVAAAAAVLGAKGTPEYMDLAYNVVDYMFGRNNWGISFLSSQKIPQAVTQTYSQIYSLQPHIFPTGAISEGPIGKKSHDENLGGLTNRKIIEEDISNNPYNTENEVFVDNNGDYTTMETTIWGQAVGIYLMSAIYAYEKNI